jgi:hypothetical protein
MALRIEKTACIAILSAVLTAAPLAAESFEFSVRHDHWRGKGAGALRIDDNGVSYREIGKKNKPNAHAWTWAWDDIQEIELAPGRLRLVTYQDSKWRLGVDREYQFTASPHSPFDVAYPMLRDRLGRRFVAALADENGKPLWELPVKRLGRMYGSHGTLIVGKDRIVYRTDKKGESRTWRYSDIDNVSSSGPFELTLTTFERAKFDYGSLRSFQFQLKRPLDENRYNELWRRLNEEKGLKVLRTE